MKTRIRKPISLLLFLLALSMQVEATSRKCYNFNSQWCVQIGDIANAHQTSYNDASWKRITLPYAFNEDEAFCKAIDEHTDTIVWYRKRFTIPNLKSNNHVFVEFEGVRQRGDFYLNGHYLGKHENGVMAVGFDLTPYIRKGENVMAVRVDNDWDYLEEETQTRYQWSNKNFNANYGGIPKNVYLHVTNDLYQTLPLYSNLQTTGVYLYATDIKVKSRTATIHAESEVRNESKRTRQFHYEIELYDREGELVNSFASEKETLQPGETRTLGAKMDCEGLHFWSWGYGYLYTMHTKLVEGQKGVIDEVVTPTGFHKTRFAEGKIWLNDRVLLMKGYAQRTSNEWPAVGISVPAWLSDYSNDLMVKSNANLVRWMHVTPWRQDVESCDRVGLIQAMPAGDAEKDVEGRQWKQRLELMRDAIIYYRNNPSILFYECGNESISRDHMIEMLAVRDQYDFWGGRAIGSREMLDIDEAEYGGEMLYTNKSKKHPMWATEYCRDEALRKYWDAYSYPYHKEGEGNSMYRSTVTNQMEPRANAEAYNRNQDAFALEMVTRWYEFWRERPGTGRRVNAGGTKIIFSDTNTHYRGVENYRRSGVTDAMRIPKDAYYVHQTIWNGWVDNDEKQQTYIVGHWNYADTLVKPIYVVSTAEAVELFVNGRSQGKGERKDHFTFTFPRVAFEAGTLTAIGYNEVGAETSRYEITTVGEAVALRMTAMQNPQGFKADGADMALIEFEVVDAEGRRCPLDNRLVHFSLEGEAEWRGGIAQGPKNYILSPSLPVECGVNRALIRSTTKAGTIKLTAQAEGLPKATLTLTTEAIRVTQGVSDYLPSLSLSGRLDRGETPTTPSYADKKLDVAIASVKAGSNQEMAIHSYDDNELSEWSSDGKYSNAWISYTLVRNAQIDDICLKLTGWRSNSYPLEVYADKQLIWKGYTPKTLGYVHLKIDKPIQARQITIRMTGPATSKDRFNLVEVEAKGANELEKTDENTKNVRLRIVEIEFLESLWQ